MARKPKDESSPAESAEEIPATPPSEDVIQLQTRVQELERENANLKERVSQLTEASAASTLPPEDEAAIREKMRAGLSREQAVAVVAAQKAQDQAEAEKTKKTAKAQ